MSVPVDLTAHCAKHPMCKGYPLITCVAPHGVEITDPRWQAWIDSVAERVRVILERGLGDE